MRALLINPKFPPSYWSFEGALNLIGKKALLPPLGLITVAAILPQDWEFRLADRNCRDVTEEDWNWAEIVLISGMIVQHDDMVWAIQESKRRGLPVAVGGPYMTSVPDVGSKAGADYLVLDEGEITIPQFVEALERGETSGYFTANGQKADMSTSPVPRYDLLEFKDYSEMSLQFSRGCPFLCEFCDIIILYGRKPRTKSADQILAELQQIYDLGWRRSMFVVDDNFIGNKKTVKPVLSAMAGWQEKHGYPFSLTTEASINLADDPELLDLMQDAHFGVVFIGLESTEPETLVMTKKTQNVRRSMIDQIDTINRSGLRVMGSFIVGFDGEEAGADDRILAFAEKTNIPHVMVSMLQSLPATHLTERLRKEGRLIETSTVDGAGLNTTQITNFIPTRPLRELAEQHVRAMWELYEPKAYMTRLYHHCMTLNRPAKKQAFIAPERREVMVFFLILWRHGFKRPSRGIFWKALWDIARHNRSALKAFLACCAHFEHFEAYRETVKEEVEAQIAAYSYEELDRIAERPVSEEKPKLAAHA